MQSNRVSSAFAWISIIYIFPIFGVIFYLLFGELYIEKEYLNKSEKFWLLNLKSLYSLKKIHFWKKFFTTRNSTVANSIFQLCKKRQGFSSVQGNNLELLTDSKKIIQMLIKDINQANSNIEMIFYIWCPGGMADDVAKSLINASKRGINCRLILDSAGSIMFFRSPWANLMYKAGIKIVKALKMNILRIFLRRIDLRQHRKIILIDNYIAYTGSMNLIDSVFFKKNSKVGRWVDLMVRMTGPIAITLGSIFSYDWAMETGKFKFPSILKKEKYLTKKENSHVIQTIPSGPGFPKNIIHQALLTAIYSAKNEITMTTPYFVPSDHLLNAICTASYRGVNVKLILPHYNDSILVNWASRTFFDKLLLSGVKIYQFQKGLLHTKSILIDQQLSLIGTVNLDIRSLWLNCEITLVIDSNKFAQDLFSIQSYYIKKSKKINKRIWQKRNLSTRFLERICYFSSPFL